MPRLAAGNGRFCGQFENPAHDNLAHFIGGEDLGGGCLAVDTPRRDGGFRAHTQRRSAHT